MTYVDIYTYDKSTGYIKTHIIQIYEGKKLIEKITYEYVFITERESAAVEILPA